AAGLTVKIPLDRDRPRDLTAPEFRTHQIPDTPDSRYMDKSVLPNKEPITDIAHLGHLEILTPKFEESRRFFIDVLGMTQSGEKGDSVFLRAYDDYERYSLKPTASKTSGMGHVAYRCRSPQALERRAAALKGSGFDVGWSDGDIGHGKTFVCRDPDDH